VEDSQAILTRFNRLMRDIRNGASTRTCFKAWEVDLLLDIEACGLEPLNRRRILQRYTRAAQRRLEQGLSRPLKLSEYLARRPARSASVAGVA
jgi:hypothetical protein